MFRDLTEKVSCEPSVVVDVMIVYFLLSVVMTFPHVVLDLAMLLLLRSVKHFFNSINL